MKRYIRGTILDKDIIKQAVEFVRCFRGCHVDIPNCTIVVPLDAGMSKEQFMAEGMLGDWFIQHGFDISWSHGDHEYETQPEWRNSYAWNRNKGRKAYLRDRDIATITWR